MVKENVFDESQWQEEIKERQAICISLQEDMCDLEYRARSNKGELYRLWRMV